jgi:hypothetical protein
MQKRRIYQKKEFDNFEAARLIRNINNHSSFIVEFSQDTGQMVANNGSFTFSGSDEYGLRLLSQIDDPQVSLLPLLQQPRNIQNMYKKLKPYMYKLGEETDYAIGAAKPERVTRYHLWPCPENAETRVERGYPHKPGDQIRLPIKWDEVPVNESKTFTESSWRSLDENAPKSNKRAGPNTKNNGSGKNGRRQGWTTNTNYKHVLNDSKGWKGRKESEREQ